MSDRKAHDVGARVPNAAKSVLKCPWCRGRLLYVPRYPVMRLFPGDVRPPRDEHLPEPLRTVPAWVCETPHCKFREHA